MSDSMILQDMYFTTPEMKHIFGDRNRIQKQMDCEAALADAEAELGIIPRKMAAEIMRCSQVDLIDFEALQADFVRTGHPFVPLVHAYKKICQHQAGEYVHWGATTQDILDTGTTLQLKEAYELLMKRFEELYAVTAEAAYRYKDFVMVGRTNGQQALPITLGYKIAVWGFELRENIDRLHECSTRAFRGQLAGAVGTMASFGTQGLEVQARFLQKLGLSIPPIAWSVSRHHYAELMNDFALMAATMGKIGTEVYALQKSEIGEVEEVQGEGSVGSSTMPHKRNPFRAMELSTNARLVRGCAATLMECLELEHERDPRGASAEIPIFTQICSLVHASVERAIGLVKHLHVYPAHMQRNLDCLHGLIFSEAVMMQLGKRTGRQTAHAIVHELSMRAFQQECSLGELLKQDPRVQQHLSAEDIDAIMQPEHYIGLAPLFAERIKQQKDAYFSALKHDK